MEFLVTEEFQPIGDLVRRWWAAIGLVVLVPRSIGVLVESLPERCGRPVLGAEGSTTPPQLGVGGDDDGTDPLVAVQPGDDAVVGAAGPAVDDAGPAADEFLSAPLRTAVVEQPEPLSASQAGLEGQACSFGVFTEVTAPVGLPVQQVVDFDQDGVGSFGHVGEQSRSALRLKRLLPSESGPRCCNQRQKANLHGEFPDPR